MQQEEPYFLRWVFVGLN